MELKTAFKKAKEHMPIAASTVSGALGGAVGSVVAGPVGGAVGGAISSLLPALANTPAAKRHEEKVDKALEDGCDRKWCNS